MELVGDTERERETRARRTRVTIMALYNDLITIYNSCGCGFGLTTTCACSVPALDGAVTAGTLRNHSLTHSLPHLSPSLSPEAHDSS